MRYDSQPPFPQISMLTKHNVEWIGVQNKHPIMLKRVRCLLFNFEFRGHGGEAHFMILYEYRAFILQTPVVSMNIISVVVLVLIVVLVLVLVLLLVLLLLLLVVVVVVVVVVVRLADVVCEVETQPGSSHCRPGLPFGHPKFKGI